MNELVDRVSSSDIDLEAYFARLAYANSPLSPDIRDTVSVILNEIEHRGDEALVKYCNQLDGRQLTSSKELALELIDLEKAFKNLSDDDRSALHLAASRIQKYHEYQLENSGEFIYVDEHGNRLGQTVNPLNRVGVYIPGGQAAYPSTVLMTVIPARVAGVKEVVMMVPAPGGRCPEIVLAAAHIGGVNEVYTAGGAQAIGAMAFGTETIMPVDKIVGPGGAYVAAAKREVFGQVGIDVIAGPSELLIIADGTVSPEWIVLDMFSQAEHASDAQAILLCPEKEYLDQIYSLIGQMLPKMERVDIIRESLSQRGALIKTSNLEECVRIANLLAPEHLELATKNPENLVGGIYNAGAVFLGAQSPEVMGDYNAGPSHVLPTSGTARFSSPLGVYDFQKRTSIIELSKTGSNDLAGSAELLANREGLFAHGQAAKARKQEVD